MPHPPKGRGGGGLGGGEVFTVGAGNVCEGDLADFFLGEVFEEFGWLHVGEFAQEQIDWLLKRPFSMTYTPELGHEFHVYHGTPYDIGDGDAFPFRLTDDELAEKLKGYDADIMAHGHIHGPSVRHLDKGGKKQTVVCAAAVGMSWDGDPRPAYAVVDYLGEGKWEARTERVEFDQEEQAKFNENCWLEHGERIAGMIRSGTFWNPDHMPH